MLGQFNARFLNPADDPFRGTGFDRSLQHQFGRMNGTFFCARMRGENNAVAGFERNQALKNRGRCRIGSRNNSGDNAERFGNPGQSVGFVMFQNAAGLCVAVFVINFFGGKMVFDNLVFNHAHSSFLNSHLG